MSVVVKPQLHYCQGTELIIIIMPVALCIIKIKDLDLPCKRTGLKLQNSALCEGKQNLTKSSKHPEQLTKSNGASLLCYK